MDSALANVSIPLAVDRCARSLLSLAETLKRPTRFAEQVSAGTVLDEFDRFKLWAGNIAAHRKGHRSLEYRLRDAPELRFETNDLLASLSTALDDAMAIVEGKRLPWDEETFSDTDSDWSDDVDDSKFDHALQGDTELKQLHVRSRSTITSLMRLTMAIREPAPSRQALRIDLSYHEPYDIQHVQAKFGESAPYLIERLGRAISSRRQYFAYRQQHRQKLSKGVEEIGFEEPRTEHTDNSTEATPLPSSDPASWPTSTNSNLLDDGDETLSQTSYASSFKSTIRTPRLPKEASKGEPYECPLCFSLIAVYTHAVWKRHVYHDLHPYCCTFEDCPTADRLYYSRNSWYAHELEAHHTTFQCVESCDQIFTAEATFHTHVQQCHPDLATPAMYSALKRTSARSANLTDRATCKLCNESMTLRSMRKHLGHHQEQLSLFSLPATVEECAEDSEDSDRERERSENIDADEINYLREISNHADGNTSYLEKDEGEASLARLQRPLLLQQNDLIKRDVLAEAAAEEKRKSDEEKLARLEKLILAQKDEILKHEAAAEEARISAAAKAADEAAKKLADKKKAEAEAAAILLQVANEAREEVERRAAAEAEATRLEYEKALAEAKAEFLEKLEKGREAEPLNFKDAVGRKFTFPWYVCNTWAAMEHLIKGSFAHVEGMRDLVDQGHYDLVGPDGEIIDRWRWEETVQPGWSITMHMWPLPEPLDTFSSTPHNAAVGRTRPSRTASSSRSSGTPPAHLSPPPSSSRQQAASPTASPSSRKPRKPPPIHYWGSKGKEKSQTGNNDDQGT